MRLDEFYQVELTAGQPTVERSDLSVPVDDVSIPIRSVDTVINVSPKMSISTQTRYDNISDNLSLLCAYALGFQT